MVESIHQSFILIAGNILSYLASYTYFKRWADEWQWWAACVFGRTQINLLDTRDKHGNYCEFKYTLW